MMEFTSNTNLTQLNRQEALELWKRRNGLSFAEMGRRIGLTGEQVSNLCGSETMPPHRHLQLLGLGIPAELLPPPLYRKPGPKPKIETATAA